MRHENILLLKCGHRQFFQRSVCVEGLMDPTQYLSKNSWFVMEFERDTFGKRKSEQHLIIFCTDGVKFSVFFLNYHSVKVKQETSKPA
jgi:hypothetical protein